MRAVTLLAGLTLAVTNPILAQGSCEGITEPAGIRRCLEGALVVTNESMNSLVRQIRDALPAERRPAFDAAQRAWSTHLTADLAFLVTLFPPEDSAKSRLGLHNTFAQNRMELLRSVLNEMGITTPAAAGSTAERAYMAAMRSDLRNLVTAEEAFFADSVTYTTSLRNLRYQASRGVTVTISIATPTGWSARATHAQLPRVTCYVFVGNARPGAEGLNEGEPRCDRR